MPDQFSEAFERSFLRYLATERLGERVKAHEAYRAVHPDDRAAAASPGHLGGRAAHPGRGRATPLPGVRVAPGPLGPRSRRRRGVAATG